MAQRPTFQTDSLAQLWPTEASPAVTRGPAGLWKSSQHGADKGATGGVAGPGGVVFGEDGLAVRGSRWCVGHRRGEAGWVAEALPEGREQLELAS